MGVTASWKPICFGEGCPEPAKAQGASIIPPRRVLRTAPKTAPRLISTPPLGLLIVIVLAPSPGPGEATRLGQSSHPAKARTAASTATPAPNVPWLAPTQVGSVRIGSARRSCLPPPSIRAD